MYKGIDILGLAMQPLHVISEAMKPGCSFGFLMGTFGNSIPNAMYLIENNHPPAVRVHLSNGPCARNHNCGDGEIGAREYGKMADRARKIETLAKANPHTRFFVSPRVEHDETRAIVLAWQLMLAKHAPSCTCVISSGPKGTSMRGFLTEAHGNKARGDTISNDGESIFDAPNNWSDGAHLLALAWDYSCNFRSKDETNFVTPRNRSLALGLTHDKIVKMQELVGL